MSSTSSARRHGLPVHRPVETRTPDGKTRICCAGTGCEGWDPCAFETRAEAQFWYERHIAQPLTRSLWL